MEGSKKDCFGFLCLLLFFVSSAITHCDARRSSVRHLDSYTSSDPYSYVGSPFTLPPYDDVMGSPSPSSSPKGEPLYCVYPPPQSPSTTLPTPSIYSSPPPPSPPLPPPSPPPSPIYSSPPFLNPSPPEYTHAPPEFTPSPPSYEPSPPGYGSNPPIIVVPSPPEYVPNPPEYVPSPPSYEPGPPSFTPSPPEYSYSPPEFVPGPPIFQPPVVYPQPSVPPSPSTGVNYALWCVAKPSVPDPIIQEAMNYACGSGADCDSIQPNGSCYAPNTLIEHASFAFNSYWQRTKAAGATCDFGGTAMLVTKDPSFDGCHFLRT